MYTVKWGGHKPITSYLVKKDVIFRWPFGVDNFFFPFGFLSSVVVFCFLASVGWMPNFLFTSSSASRTSSRLRDFTFGGGISWKMWEWSLNPGTRLFDQYFQFPPIEARVGAATARRGDFSNFKLKFIKATSSFDKIWNEWKLIRFIWIFTYQIFRDIWNTKMHLKTFKLRFGWNRIDTQKCSENKRRKWKIYYEYRAIKQFIELNEFS